MNIIQLQATTEQAITAIFGQVKDITSNICGGIDDMHFLGNKALIVRAEIFPGKLNLLCEKLNAIDVRVDPSSAPDFSSLDTEREYMITVQVTSFSADTDRRTEIPRVPG